MNDRTYMSAGLHRVSLSTVLDTYTTGDEGEWAEEFAHLRTHHAKRIAKLTVEIAAEGIKVPITLGYDGRVWDGHHRLAVADALGTWPIPVTQLPTPPPTTKRHLGGAL